MLNLQKYINQTEGNSEVKLWIEKILSSYLKKNPENQSEIEHILDYLKSKDAPKRLLKMSYKQAVISTDAWVKRLTKKGNNIDDSEHIKSVLKFKDGYRLVRLIGKPAFEREGNLMSHCVASYYDKKGTKVYSLRDPNNNPHCTIEATGGKSINQIKGKGNGSIHPKYIHKVLRILKRFKMTINQNEMSNLGYVHFSESEVEWIKNTCPNVSITELNGDKYVFTGC